MSLPKSGLFQATSTFHWRYFFGEASKFISPPIHQKKKSDKKRKIAPLHQLQDQGLSGAVNVKVWWTHTERRRLGSTPKTRQQRAPRLVGLCRFKRCFPLAFYWWNPHFVWSTKAIKTTKPQVGLEVLEILEGQPYFCWKFKRLSHLGEHPAIWHLFAAVRIAPRWHGRSIPMGPPAPVPHLGLQTSIQKTKLQLVKMPPWGPPSRNYQLGPVD